MEIEYGKMLKWFQHNHPDKIDQLIESLSPNQIECKKWVATELEALWLDKKWDIHIEQIGGWFGWPLLRYIKHLPVQSYRNVDKDQFATQVFNQYVKFFEPSFETTSVNEDIVDLRENNASRRTRVVINTSCEHMRPMPEVLKSRGYIDEKVVFFLQSNNMIEEPSHINCVKSVDELIQQNKIEKVYYAGEKDMGHYKRFMVVGKWK